MTIFKHGFLDGLRWSEGVAVERSEIPIHLQRLDTIGSKLKPSPIFSAKIPTRLWSILPVGRQASLLGRLIHPG
jgi:hypothetical protein